MTTALSTDELLSTTRAVRKRLDLDRPVPVDLVRECLDLALQGPTGANEQNWHWIVVQDSEARKQIGDYYSRATKDYLSSPYAPDEKCEEDSEHARTQQRITESAAWLGDRMGQVPILLIPCIDTEGPLPSGNQAGIWGSLLPAVWSFMLAARSRGLGTAWTTLHLEYEAEIRRLLGIPEGVHQGALIPVAFYKGERFSPAKRAPLDSVLHLDSW